MYVLLHMIIKIIRVGVSDLIVSIKQIFCHLILIKSRIISHENKIVVKDILFNFYCSKMFK